MPCLRFCLLAFLTRHWHVRLRTFLSSYRGLMRFLNSAMLFGRHGGRWIFPVTFAGKLFAGLYALYAGLVFHSQRSVNYHPSVCTECCILFHWDEKILTSIFLPHLGKPVSMRLAEV